MDTQEQITVVLETYNSGLTIKQVADTLQYGKRKVHRILKQQNALRWRKITPELEQTIISEYQDGASQRELHLKYNATRVTIRNILKRNNIDITPWEHVRLNETEQIELRKQWNDGVSRKDIMKYFKISGSTLNRWLKLLNEPLRRLAATGPKHGSWKGGKSNTTNGYSVVWVPNDDSFYSMANCNGYVPEHRYIMAQHLGRPLQKNESVHHIDGNKTNNDINNLQLRIGQHGTGQCFRCCDCGSTNIEPIEID